MSSANDIKMRIQSQPFVPLRVVTTTGQNYDIFHPDLAIVGTRFLMIGLPSAQDPTVAEQVTRVALLHVTKIQDLPQHKSSSGNGTG
jgi:hypothetical protein